MSRRRRLRRVVESLPPPSGPVVENPNLFAAWAWLRPADDFDAPRLRGGPVFEEMARLGFRVQTIPAGVEARVEVWRPWTFVVLSVPSSDASGWIDELPNHSSVIMDCHFPIMDMETAIGANDQLVDIIDNKDMLLANLAAADVVTVPRPEWAADLAEVNPNVFLLPDYDERCPQAFHLRLGEVALASQQVKAARARLRGEMGL